MASTDDAPSFKPETRILAGLEASDDPGRPRREMFVQAG